MLPTQHVPIPLAAQEGVDFVPGSRFFPAGEQGRAWLRLNFVSQTPEDIEDGIERLGQAIKDLIANN